jgi:hypothetical protein
MTQPAISPFSVPSTHAASTSMTRSPAATCPRYPELPFRPRSISLPEHQHAQIDYSPLFLWELQNLFSVTAIGAFLSRIVLLLAQDRLSSP